ncbi:MAG: cytidylate kinase-like family protein [Thermoproteota archaeon]
MGKKGPIILLAGELGAGCTEVGEILVNKLGLPVYNTERFIRSLVSSPGLSFQALAEKSLSGEIEIEKVLYSMVLDVINNGPAIIEGRSALLALTYDVDLKVFLYRDWNGRIKHLAERRKTEDVKQMEEDLKASDIDRRSLVERLFHRDWKDPVLYDLMINTSRSSLDEAATIILNILKLKGY